MIKEAYVSFEIAKLLKEKGFDWSISPFSNQREEEAWVMYYSETIANPEYDDSIPFDSPTKTIVYPHVTHQKALAWLREKGFYIQIFVGERGQGVCWSVCVHDLKSKGLPLCEERSIMCKKFNSYEEAVEAGLLYVLKELL